MPGFESETTAAGPGFAAAHGPMTADGELPVIGARPLGGGARGRFRIYSVTDSLPEADLSTWSLTVSGLVERPLQIDGSPLPTPLGGPVRLVIPSMYAYKSVKWVQAVELIDEPHDGYWEVRGYPADAKLLKG